MSERKEEAIEFVREYAKTHYIYTSDQVLVEFRKQGGSLKDAGRGNSINWGNVVDAADRKGIHETIARVPPNESHAHTPTTCLRRSCVFEGDTSEFDEIDTAKDYIQALYVRVVNHELTVREALRLAYKYGVEQ